MKPIIVEGPDGSGKSSLIKTLIAARPELKLVPSLGPNPSRKALLVKSEKAMEQNAISDRYPGISEFIYSAVLRKSPRLGLGLMLDMRRDLINTNVVYCRPPNWVLFDVSHQTTEKYDTLEHVNAVRRRASHIIAMYDNTMSDLETMHKMTVVRYDWTKDNWPILLAN